MRVLGTVVVATAVATGGMGRPAGAEHRPQPKVLTEPRIACPGEARHRPRRPRAGGADHPRHRGLRSRAVRLGVDSDAEIVGSRRTDQAAALLKGGQRYVLPDPSRFIKLASKRTIEAEAVFTRSGAAVSGDGYVVTNAHVVAPDEDFVFDALVEDACDEFEDDLVDVLDDVDAKLFNGTMSLDAEEALESGYTEFVGARATFRRSATARAAAASRRPRPARRWPGALSRGRFLRPPTGR